MSITPTKWIYIGFPGRSRSMFATYEMFDYEDLPEIKIDPQFSEIETIEDVKENQEGLDRVIRAPTACYFDFSEPNLFYRDQQDCVLWYYTSEKGVYVKTGEVVAKSIPEFLTRIYLENQIEYANKVAELDGDALAYFRHYNPEERN